MPSDFLPASDAQFDLWLTNFLTEFTNIAAGHGFDPPEIASLTAAASAFGTALADQQAAVANARSGPLENAPPAAASFRSSGRTSNASKRAPA